MLRAAFGLQAMPVIDRIPPKLSVPRIRGHLVPTSGAWAKYERPKRYIVGCVSVFPRCAPGSSSQLHLRGSGSVARQAQDSRSGRRPGASTKGRQTIAFSGAKLAPMSRAGRYLGVSEAFDSEWRLGVEHRLGVVVSRAL